MTTAPVSAAASPDNQIGLNFQSLLQIILTQLTAQDPLHPLDNFQFVTQLAEFSQLQLTDTMSSNITNLLASQSAVQAVGLLGRTVDLASSTSSSTAPVTGAVKAVAFNNGTPELTIQTTGGQTIANVLLSQITQVM